MTKSYEYMTQNLYVPDQRMYEVMTDELRHESRVKYFILK